MNKQGNAKNPSGGIEWTHIFGPGTGYTANPVRGCRHQCHWRMPDGKIAACYAARVAAGVAKEAYPHGFASVTYNPLELVEILLHQQPAGIFIDSMSDLFGAWVPSEQIARVVSVARQCPQHVFFMLTKNPARLQEFRVFPKNVFVGVSIPPTSMNGAELSDGQREAWFDDALTKLGAVECKARFVSLEPLWFECSGLLTKHRAALDWAIIGAASDGPRTYQPEDSTLARAVSALKCPVFIKNNVAGHVFEAVALRRRQEWPLAGLIGPKGQPGLPGPDFGAHSLKGAAGPV